MPGVIVSSSARTLKVISTADNNAALVQAGPSVLAGLCLYNAAVTARYVKIYDKATAPAPASDAALVKAELVIPPGGALQIFPGLSVILGLGIAITGGSALADNTSISAADVIGTVFYL